MKIISPGHCGWPGLPEEDYSIVVYEAVLPKVAGALKNWEIIRGLSASHPRITQAIEALARILEAEAFRDYVLATQPVQRIADCPRRKISPVNELFLG